MTITTGCPCCAYPQPAARPRDRGRWAGSDRAPGALLLDGGSIVDPRDGSITGGTGIRIDGGRITDVGPSGAEHPSAERIDVTGKFIVPGYNDMHSHALNPADPSGSLALMLAEGVTGFRQMSGSPALLTQRRNNTLPIGPAAPALLQMPGSILTPFNAGTPEAAAAEVRRQQAQGADFVKMVMAGAEVFFAAVKEGRESGIPVLGHLQEGVDAVAASAASFRSVEHLGPGSSVWATCSTINDELIADARAQPTIKGPPFKVPFLERVVMWRMQNLLVNPAAYSSVADVVRIQRALDAFSDHKAAAVAEQLAAHGTWHVPTLVRLRSMQQADAPEYQHDELLRYMPAGNIRRWRRVTEKFKALPRESRDTYRSLYPRQLKLAKLFCDSGVRMMTGTDGGSMLGPGLTLRQEFAELAAAGISPLRILQMTTIDPADYLGRRDTMGTVEPARNADLVVLDANPLDAVENMHRISAVIRAGRHYSSAQLADLKARVAAGAGVLQRS